MRRLLLFPIIFLLPLLATAIDLRQIAIIDVPGNPGFSDVALINNALVIAHPGAGSVDVFDVTRRRVIATVNNLEGPRGVAGSSKTGKVYIANAEGQSVTVLSMNDWKVEDTIALNDSPFGLAISPDGRRLYTANWQDRSITAIELERGFRQNTVDVEGTPESVLFEPASGLVYATLQDRAEVVALDPSLKVVKRFKLQASQPTGVAADATGKRIFVAVRFAVLALDAETGAELGRVAAPGGVDGLWFDATTGNLYGVAAGAVTIVQTNGGFRALDEVKTDVKGHSLAFDASRGYVYVPGGREGRAKLLILKHVQPQPEVQQVANNK